MKKWREVTSFLGIAGGAALLHLAALGNFPLFADEAIYIRWAQLFIDDWHQYLFFALNDGKTPLFIWALAPFQFLFTDQLVAGRFLSVLMAIGQVFASRWVVKQLGGKTLAQLSAALLSVLLPFWYFYHHLALMDGMLTLSLTLAFGCAISLIKSASAKKFPLGWVVLSAAALGTSLWTKLPALFFVPSIALSVFTPTKAKVTFKQKFLWVVLVIVGGMVLFATLRISPAFGQLFRRSQDFAATSFSFRDSVSRWSYLLTLTGRTFVAYLTAPVLLLAISGLFYDRTRRNVGVLLLSAVSFCLPFVLLGGVVHTRYLLPAAIGLTLAAALALEQAYEHWILSAKNLQQRMVASVVLVSVLSLSLNTILPFIYAVNWQPNDTAFLAEDREQYLTEWSSGHGIRETVGYIQLKLDSGKSIAVATEGRFGTLPDGLLLFFHRRNVDHLYIEGTGQFPVKTIPVEFAQKAKNFDQSILVVNSHRMQLPISPDKKLAEYCRPYSAPCLQLWDITELVQSAAATSTQSP